MNRKFALAIVGLVALAAAGCGGSADGRPRKWSYISPVIIQPNCATANCHSQLSKRQNLVMDTTYNSWSALHGFATPGGLLSQVLRGTSTSFKRMPPDFPLADADIELIEAWGADGALWDGPGMGPPGATP